MDTEKKTYNILIELHQTRLAIVINDENTLDHGSFVAAVVCPARTKCQNVLASLLTGKGCFVQ